MLINLGKVLYTTIDNWYITLTDTLHFKPFILKDRYLHATIIYIHVYIYYVNEISFASPRHLCQITSYKKTFKSSDFLRHLTLSILLKRLGESGSFNTMLLLNRKLMIISPTLLNTYCYYVPRTTKI